ncbi:DUF7385 family protein [Halorientalis pallida]|uniref:Uncharacterized protein n=1 Tax=Halorientalis pallida TaxID=2479928 RepID=A0A498KYZ8_9EURY|nr:hypothetical protein [Halorientalis pallida]RXK51299.1 hypothetical protein EAF64_01260 [Halorientalis pallida]
MDGYDELVSSLTPRQESDSVSIYQNTVGLACPACESPFDNLIVCRDEYNSLELDFAMDICTAMHDGNPLLFTHKH